LNTTWKITIVTILFWGFSAWNPLRSTAATPTEQLQGTLEEIVAILKNSPSNSEADATAFRTNLIQAISPRFDFTEMAKRCLGSHWGNRTAEEQREFVKILAGFLGRSYVGNIQPIRIKESFIRVSSRTRITPKLTQRSLQNRPKTYSLITNCTSSTTIGKFTTSSSIMSALSTTTGPSLTESLRDHPSKTSLG